jgi:hypothetical protein
LVAVARIRPARTAPTRFAPTLTVVAAAAPLACQDAEAIVGNDALT